MFAMTASVRPLEAVPVLPQLAQALRRQYEHILLYTGQMLVVIPLVGSVLVTEDRRRMQFDLVTDDEAGFTARRGLLESELRRRLPGIALRIDWNRSASIPVPFR